MNIFKRIFSRKQKPRLEMISKAQAERNTQLAMARQQLELAKQVEAEARALLEAVVKPQPENPTLHPFFITEQERRSLLKAAAQGMYGRSPTIETPELTEQDYSVLVDLITRMGLAVETFQAVNPEGDVETRASLDV